jgi:hypothetical protein
MKRLYRKLLRRIIPPRTLTRVNHLAHIDERLLDADAARALLAEAWLRDRHPALFAPPAPGQREFSLFSQNGEDGILLWLLDLTGAPVKTFVEIGIENGRECNTAVLAFLLGWDGLMLEANALGVHQARRLAQRLLARKANRVDIRQELVTAENVNALIAEAGYGGELGVLSIDVDGMDYWLWKALSVARPRLVIVEYNATLGANRAVTVPYQRDFECRRAHASGFYHGASLPALELLGRRRGYQLAAVESAGVNAFFVREDICPPALRSQTAAGLFRDHFARTRTMTPGEQWELIRHLPLVSVESLSS